MRIPVVGPSYDQRDHLNWVLSCVSRPKQNEESCPCSEVTLRHTALSIVYFTTCTTQAKTRTTSVIKANTYGFCGVALGTTLFEYFRSFFWITRWNIPHLYIQIRSIICLQYKQNTRAVLIECT